MTWSWADPSSSSASSSTFGSSGDGGVRSWERRVLDPSPLRQRRVTDGPLVKGVSRRQECLWDSCCPRISPVSTLADAVLPLIRTRADLSRWGAANAHGRQMHAAVDLVEAAVPTTDPGEVYAVTHKALASAIKVIARADDSSGIIGDACRRLLDAPPAGSGRGPGPAQPRWSTG